MKHLCAHLLLTLLLCALCLVAGISRAADVYVVFGQATIPLPEGSGSSQWVTTATVFNTAAEPATGHLIGVSNGATPLSTDDVIFAPSSLRAFPGSWFPANPLPPLFVFHVDLPNSVLVSDRLFQNLELTCNGFETCGPGNQGPVSLPVLKSLVPAGTRQVLLDADLGGDVAVRANVSLYNGGSTSANATIEVHRGCDDALLAALTATVPPNTIIQVPAFSEEAPTGTTESCDTGRPQPGLRYLTVLMDQPGFSLLAVLRNGTLNYAVPFGTSSGR